MFYRLDTPTGTLGAASPDGGDLSRLGWEFFFDTSYPDENNALAIDADVWTVIPNNKGFILPTATNLPADVPGGVSGGFYDGVTQLFTFDDINAEFKSTVGFAIVPSTANATIQVRGLTGLGSPFFGPTSYPLSVDAGDFNVFNVDLQTPTTQNLVDNGVQFSIKCSADCEIWGAAYQIAKVVQK
jgi:hypothetical protein